MEQKKIMLELRDAINHWLSKNLSRNIVMLSKGSGVNQSTLRRAYNQQGLPVARNLLKILLFINGNLKINDVLKKYSKETKNYLRYTYNEFII